MSHAALAYGNFYILHCLQVGCVLGRRGANIAILRSVSGARVKLHDAAEGAMERVVEISGTLEQTQAVQNLMQVCHH